AKGSRCGKLLVDMHRVVVAGHAGKQHEVGLGDRLGERCAHADAKVLHVVAIELVHDAVPKPTASLPFSPSIARASAGLATSRDSSSRIRLILRTCSALALAIWPLPRYRLSPSPTRTLPPIPAPLLTSEL